MRTHRSRVLIVLPLLVCGASCGGSGSDGSDDGTQAFGFGIPPILPNSAPAKWDDSVPRPQNEGLAAAMRRACTFKRGALPAATLGSEIPIGDGANVRSDDGTINGLTVDDTQIPIQHIIVMMQENRSFDSYYAHLAAWAAKNVKGADGNNVALDIDGAKEPLTFPRSIDGSIPGTVDWIHADRLCQSDLNHEWFGAHIQWNGGKNDGFFQSNEGFTEKGQPVVGAELLSGQRGFTFYDERDIPFYYHLASRFAIGDRYFSSVIGPTWPNRDFLYAASSYGASTNINPFCPKLGIVNSVTCKQKELYNRDTVIFDELTRRGIPWKFFVDPTVGQEAKPGSLKELIQKGKEVLRLGAFLAPQQLAFRYGNSTLPEHVGSYLDLVRILAAGKGLPAVTFIDAAVEETADGEDEHPPADIQSGQNLVWTIVETLMGSKYWANTALFLTYDENGGIYDHVPPPQACSPETQDLGDPAPKFMTPEDTEFAAKHADINTKFDRYGFRVPLIVVSPYAKRSHVSHTVYDHTSILRFIEAKFRLPALTARDANAEAMFDLFDFKANGGKGPWATPPSDLPPQPFENGGSWIDPAKLAECRALFDKDGKKY